MGTCVRGKGSDRHRRQPGHRRGHCPPVGRGGRPASPSRPAPSNLTPRYEGSLVDTAEAIRAAGGEAIPIQCDISKADDRRRLVAETEAQLGQVEILVNNAAVTFLLPYEDFPEKRFRLMVEVQLWAPYELGQLVVPGMRRRGEGWILNISSRAASHPADRHSTRSTKAGSRSTAR